MQALCMLAARDDGLRNLVALAADGDQEEVLRVNCRGPLASELEGAPDSKRIVRGPPS
jgi:hypothetical protein